VKKASFRFRKFGIRKFGIRKFSIRKFPISFSLQLHPPVPVLGRGVWLGLASHSQTSRSGRRCRLFFCVSRFFANRGYIANRMVNNGQHVSSLLILYSTSCNSQIVTLLQLTFLHCRIICTRNHKISLTPLILQPNIPLTSLVLQSQFSVIIPAWVLYQFRFRGFKPGSPAKTELRKTLLFTVGLFTLERECYVYALLALIRKVRLIFQEMKPNVKDLKVKKASVQSLLVSPIETINE